MKNEEQINNEITKEAWLRLKRGDVIFSKKSRKPYKIIDTWSSCKKLDTGAVYSTAERGNFFLNPSNQ